MLGAIFDRFGEHSPVSVMARGLMERVFASEQINRIFEANAPSTVHQRTTILQQAWT